MRNTEGMCWTARWAAPKGSNVLPSLAKNFVPGASGQKTRPPGVLFSKNIFLSLAQKTQKYNIFITTF